MPIAALNPGTKTVTARKVQEVTESVTINAVAAGDIHIATYIRDDGVLTARVVVRIADGQVEDPEQENSMWLRLGTVPVGAEGVGQTVLIEDVLDPPADLPIDTEILQVFGLLVTIVKKINEARQII